MLATQRRPFQRSLGVVLAHPFSKPHKLDFRTLYEDWIADLKKGTWWSNLLLELCVFLRPRIVAGNVLVGPYMRYFILGLLLDTKWLTEELRTVVPLVSCVKPNSREQEVFVTCGTSGVCLGPSNMTTGLNLRTSLCKQQLLHPVFSFFPLFLSLGRVWWLSGKERTLGTVNVQNNLPVPLIVPSPTALNNFKYFFLVLRPFVKT